MENLRAKILAQFEPDIAAKLLEFGETISKQESDVFVFMSRKFCCLYDLLLSIGVPPVQKPIVSDKVLDLDTNIFKNKIVTIVDDVIICGTTIWKAKDKLLNHFGAKEVKTSVFCVDEKYWVKECIEPEYKAAILSEDRALTFCSSIVSSMSIAPRPYAIEFPYFADIDIKSQYWQQILSSTNWNVYDISNKLQEDNGVSTLTFFPSVTILEELKGSFGESVIPLIDIAKVRVYAKKVNWGVKMSILPIVTFKPLTQNSIDSLFNNLIEILQTFGLDETYVLSIRSSISPIVAKLRFIQYASALVLASKFKYSLERLLDKAINFELRELDVELLFGYWNLPGLKAIVRLFLDKDDRKAFNILGISSANLDLEKTELIALMEDKQSELVSMLDEEDDFPKDDPRNIFSDFSNIFLSLYFKKEIPSREAVAKAAAKGDWEAIRKIDRLETGITWTGILEYLRKIFKYELNSDVKNVLSLVLDYSVDKGICVPVTRFSKENNVVFRAYRHGEDVKFAEEETELCGLAIENAQTVINKGEIPKLFLEKLLVLFIKVGSAKNILQVQYGTTGQEGIAKIGFYLQGAVVQLKKTNAYNAEANLWLSKHLVEKEVIRRSGHGLYTFYKHYPAIQVSSLSRTEAQKFGYILGLLYKGYKDSDESTVRLDDDDLVFLSTCYRPRDVSAALLVEIDLYLEDLLPLFRRANEDYSKKRINRADLHKKMLVNRGYTALNQLHKKIIGWQNQGAPKAIEKGRMILDKISQPIAKFDWDGYWVSLEILKREDEEKEFSEFISKLSCVGHRILFYANLFEVVLTFDKSDPGYKNNTVLKTSTEKLINFYNRSIKLGTELFTDSEHQLYENLKKLIESDFRDFNEQRTLNFINKKISELNYEVSKLTPLVRNKLEEFEQTGDGVIFYDYVVYYDIVDSTATKKMQTQKEIETYRDLIRRIKNEINGFVNQMQKKAKEEKDEMYCWNGDENSSNDAKYVFFSSSKRGFSVRRIREFIDRLYNLSGSEVSFRAVVCPANAFYSKVFKRFQRTEVEGSQFWEHYSRVQKYFKTLEGKYSKSKNLVLVIGNESTPVESTKLNLKQKMWSGEIETVIAAGYFKTLGELWVP